MVRQKMKDRTQATSKQLSLLLEEIYRNYRYSGYVTNLKLPIPEIWRLYRRSGDAENRIKELKYYFGFDSFNLHGFFALEAALTFAMIAYILKSLFRMFVVKENKKNNINTQMQNICNWLIFRKREWPTCSQNRTLLKMTSVVLWFV